MTKRHQFQTQKDRDLYIVKQRKRDIPTVELADELGITDRQVRNIYQNYQRAHRVGRKKGQGRKKSINGPICQRILNIVKKDPFLTCEKIALKLPKRIGRETVRKFLKSHGYVYKKPSKVPNLSQEDKRKRVEFAEKTMEIEQNDVIFTDEATFTLNGNSKVWAKEGVRVPQITYTYAPKVQVWGAIGSQGKVYLETFQGNMSSDIYVEMINDRFWPKIRTTVNDNFIFQQDGARAHTALATRTMLEENHINYMDWPARSPDLSPIENVWSMLKNKVYRRHPQDVMELEETILEEWEALDDTSIGRLASSFRNRLEQVIEAEGECIDY